MLHYCPKLGRKAIVVGRNVTPQEGALPSQVEMLSPWEELFSSQAETLALQTDFVKAGRDIASWRLEMSLPLE